MAHGLSLVAHGSSLADGQLVISSGRGGAAAWLRDISSLRALNADLAILLPNSFRSALLARLSGATRRVGYGRDGRGMLLTDRLAPRRGQAGRYEPVPAIDYYLALAQMLDAPPDGRRMELRASPAEQAAADELLAAAGRPGGARWVMLNPGAGFGPSKLWPARRYAELADALMGDGFEIIINAAPGERDVAEQVAESMAGPPAINMARHANSIGLLKGLLRRCRLLVTNDTGSRHIAAALGIGLVTIFGSTDPDWTTLDYPLERIVRLQAPCGPCQRKMCPQPAGPRYHQCMQLVETAEVLAAARELLSR